MSILTNPLTLDSFKESMKQWSNNQRSSRFLLAVSGGKDSMVLLELFHKLKLNFQVAHVNYHLRGEDSNRDQELVEDYCKNHQIPFHLYSVSEKDQVPSHSIQLWARELRYSYFFSLKQSQELDYIVTAHHVNDQMETFFIQLSRASGLKGLKGIPKESNHVIRPLLGFSSKAIEEFAQKEEVQFREDLSNQSDFYLRNRIRHQLLPGLKDIHPHFENNLLKSMEIIAEAQEFIEISAKNFLEKHAIRNENNLWEELDLNELEKQHSAVQFEVLQTFGFEFKEEMEKLFSKDSGHYFSNKTGDFIVEYGKLKRISNKTEVQKEEQDKITITDAQGAFLQESKVLEVLKSLEPMEWQFQRDQLSFPLHIRHQLPGDLFFPIGMIGKKKISKFFKDEKISILARPNLWILCDHKDRVLGILPLRQDRRFTLRKANEPVYIFNPSLR